eukprot:8289773-Alexandrium_andersonii.AAC.1
MARCPLPSSGPLGAAPAPNRAARFCVGRPDESSLILLLPLGTLYLLSSYLNLGPRGQLAPLDSAWGDPTHRAFFCE